ncbi:MAG: hypothetical protein Kow00103_14620 [Candidatus Caldatribacteriota bacterium]
MRTVVVIPTYWGRKRENFFQEGDIVYDHPTPIDMDGTLSRILESMKILNKKDFKLVILVCPTTKEIERQAEAKVKKIVREVNLDVETYVFTKKILRKIKKFGRKTAIKESILSLLNLEGYANVRNMCLLASQILNADISIFLDDDEVIENPDFMDIAQEFIGKRVYGETVYAVAGYYINKYGNYYDDVSMEPWMTYWNRFGSKSKAFDKIIGCEPRLKHTPFAFGGAMVIHKNLYQIVPFDPYVSRGEDIDYLINAKMFGFNFFLDNKLSVKHLPPPKTHPVWKRTREDIYRFLYERAKINSQYEVSNMRMVSAKDFTPYPGEFLTNELEDKVFKTNLLLALEYLSKGNVEACQESIKNIYLSVYEAIPKKDPFTAYRRIQKDWEKLIDFTLEHKRELRKILEEANILKMDISFDAKHYEKIDLKEKIEILKKMKGFEGFADNELEKIARMSSIKAYKQDEYIFKEGEEDSSFYIVIRGCLRIVKYNERNEEIVLADICSGGFLGETAIVNERHQVNAIASEFVELLFIEQKDLDLLIKEDANLGNKLLFIFLEKLSKKLDKTNRLFQKNYLLGSSSLSDMD